MFFILSKTIYYILMPTFLLAVGLLYAAIKTQGKTKKWIWGIFVFYYLFTNNYVADSCLKVWEIAVTPLKEVKHHKLAVVLTGVTNYSKEPFDRVYFSRGADRVMHTVLLYKKNLVDKILITGGEVKFDGKRINEAEQLRNVFLLSGVPDSVIIMEKFAKNTYENAKLSKPFIEKISPTEKVLLITSAFHARRSQMCFAKQGVKFDTFTVDFLTSDKLFLVANLAPSSSAFHKWEILIHELLGVITYKLMGYI